MKVICHVDCRPWKVFVDDTSNAMGAGAGILIITPKGIMLEHSFRLGFRASNNETEYEALLVRLRVVLDMGAWEVKVYLDSRWWLAKCRAVLKPRKNEGILASGKASYESIS